jgi:hypothetical protein
MSLFLLLRPRGAPRPEVIFVFEEKPLPWKLQFGLNNLAAQQWVQAVEGVEITASLGQRSILHCQTIDPRPDSANAYRPTTGWHAQLSHLNGTILFDGEVTNIFERPIEDPNVGVITEIEATSYDSILEQRFANELVFGGDRVSVQQVC